MIYMLEKPSNFNNKKYAKFDGDIGLFLFNFKMCKKYIGELNITLRSPMKHNTIAKEFNVMPNDAGLPVVSTKLFHILQNILGEKVEFHKIKVVSSDKVESDFYIMNILATVDVIDEAKTKIKKNNPYKKTIVNGYEVVLRQNTKVCLIARDKYKTSHIYVDKQIMEILETCSPKTVKCRNIFGESK